MPRLAAFSHCSSLTQHSNQYCSERHTAGARCKLQIRRNIMAPSLQESLPLGLPNERLAEVCLDIRRATCFVFNAIAKPFLTYGWVILSMNEPWRQYWQVSSSLATGNSSQIPKQGKGCVVFIIILQSPIKLQRRTVVPITSCGGSILKGKLCLLSG